MKLTGIHLLLTYGCTYECDHCFVWGSPEQHGTFTLAQLRKVVCQARDLGTIEWIYFEGGEPFLYYATLRRGVEMASDLGFKVGIVSNAYWATETEDAVEQLRPFAGHVQSLSLSRDRYHGEEQSLTRVDHARRAAELLAIPCDVIEIAQPAALEAADAVEQNGAGQYAVRFRGRAAQKLTARAPTSPWSRFDECPYENLRDPGRVHVDPLGHIHVCQGISIGNLFTTPLEEICRRYDPDAHPVVGPLLRGGPAQLARTYGVSLDERYGDACHLCDATRRALRQRFPDCLAPNQMYGVSESR
jgi:MoaA/NifB/PqqE/SkfB family radical SAM enzyme